jgi:NhaA family Na+:H+ antiporter
MIHFFKLKFVDPLLEFINDSRAIGITLLICTGLSLLISNIPGIGQAYHHLWNFHFNGMVEDHFHLAGISLPNAPILIINEFLMAFFFFLAGMEIKREMAEGELSGIHKSLLPIIAAIGGMIVPAVLFAQFNKQTAFIPGWAIPTATDIAFTLGIASLLGNRVPATLKIFITALAIIDDLGAIIVIALFYGGKIQIGYVLLCAFFILLLYLLNRNKARFGVFHWILGFLLWYCMFNSGLHATIAGVIFAMMIPIKQLRKMELKFHSPVYFLILPVFALANTAISFSGIKVSDLNSSLSWGIIVGLCIGKPLGIVGASYLLIKRGFAVLPTGVDWNKMIGAGLLAGIGFTMSIFISSLAFNTIYLEDIAKISVFIASAIAMLSGYVWLRYKK